MKILNPLGEDTSIMRTTILPSMLEILTRNYNYRNKAVRLYEIGKVYFARPDGMADEPKLLCLGGYGGGMDFFQLKGAVERILAGLRISDVTFESESENPSYHPGRCAKVYAGSKLLGVLGQIHPLAAANYGVDAELYTAELQLDGIFAARDAAARGTAAAPLPGRDARRRHRLQCGHPGRQALGVHPRRRRAISQGLRAVRRVHRCADPGRLQERRLLADAACRRPDAHRRPRRGDHAKRAEGAQGNLNATIR